jgi:outer membrane receptor protein involved in Fe transport
VFQQNTILEGMQTMYTLRPSGRLAYSFLILFGTTAWISAAVNEPNKPGADLLDLSLEQLSEITVSVVSKKTESQAHAPGVTTVVPQSEFEIYGDRNLFQLLQRQPSVYTRGSYMYPNNIASFRGDMPTHLNTHTLILFNGRPIRDSSFGGTNFPVYMTFPLEGLGGVEIIRGPGSVLYGTNAFTGVVNLKPRSIPDQKKFSISTMTGSYGYYETNIAGSGRSGDLGFVGALRAAGQNGYQYSMTDDLGASKSDNDRYGSVSGMAHLEYHGFTFDLFGASLDTFQLGALPRWNIDTHQWRVNKIFANAGYRTALDDCTDIEFNLTQNVQENDFGRYPSGSGEVDTNTSDTLGEVTLFVRPTDNLSLTAGYSLEYQSQYINDDDYQSISPYYLKPQVAYAQGDYTVNQYLKLTAGMQWLKSGQGVSDTITRYGVVITPTDKWGIKLLRGEAFRAPFAIETMVYDPPALVGNSGLMPERITTYDAQLFYNDEKTYAAVTYFESVIEMPIVRDTSVSPTSFKNGEGCQQFNGIEFETKRFLTNHWHILGSATYQNNKQDADLSPSTAPDYMAKLGTGYTWEWGSASIFNTYYSKPPRLATEVGVNPKPSALNLLSLNIDVDPARWLDIPKGRATLTFRIENLLDEDVWVPEFNRGGKPNSLPDGPGRTYYIGLKISF